MATVVTIPTLTEDLYSHEELHGSPTEQVTPEGFHATRRLKCAWSNRVKLAAQLVGQTWAQGGTGSAEKIVVALPHEYPQNPYAVAREVGIEPFGASDADGFFGSSVAAYEYAVLTVGYRTAQAGESQPQADDTLLFTERLEPSVEYVTVAATNLSWTLGGPPIDPQEVPGIPVRLLDYAIDVRNVATFNANAVLQVGVCNAQPVLAKMLNVTFPAETLLYHGWFPSRVTNASGTQLWNGEYRLTYKKDGWNKFWRSGGTAPVPMYNGAGVWKPVPPVAFDFLP